MGHSAQGETAKPRFQALLLGPFGFERDGVPIDTSRWQHRVQTLFALLLTAPDCRRTRDELIDILWPDASPATGAQNLRLLVHRLRLTLGAESSPVLSEHGWVTLNPAYRWDVDVDRVLALQSDTEAGMASLEEALARFRGETLVEHQYEDWAIPIQERVERARRTLGIRLASRYLTAGRPADAERVIEAVLEREPCDEEAMRLLLSALTVSGRRGEALRRYRRFESRLIAELGVSASAETRELVAQIAEAADDRWPSADPSNPLRGGDDDLDLSGPAEALPAPSDKSPARLRRPHGRSLQRLIVSFSALLVAAVIFFVAQPNRATSSRSIVGATGSAPGQFRGPRGLAADARGDVYVLDSGNSRVQEISPTGMPRAAFGSKGVGQLQFGVPIDAAFAPDGSLYITDGNNRRIEKVATGRTIHQIDQIGFDGGSITVDMQGVVYVTDYYHNLVQRFSPDGRWLSSVRLRGVVVGRFPFPAGIAVDGRGMIYLADRQDNRIVVVSPQGNVRATYSRGLYHPTDVALDASGNIYVADAGHDRIVKLTPTGRFLAAWGSYGSKLGQFDQPASIALDRHGDIYVSDYYNNRIEKLSPSGRFLWATDGSRPIR